MDKPDSLPYLIIVSGFSGTGKTTFARRLSDHFALPLISKDMIKEELADVLGCPDLSASIQLGRASTALVYRFTEAVLRTHHSCIIESVFELDTTNFGIIDYDLLFSRIHNILSEAR